MNTPAGHRRPAAVAEGWTVQIPMPTDRRGEPVGWLTMNGREHWLAASRMARAWREAAVAAYQKAMVPRNLDRIYVEITFRFADRTRRDPANFEKTIKPIIDALQPTKVREVRDRKTGRIKYDTDPGWGVIPDDDPRFLVRGPEQPIGEPLGRNNPIRGVVILTIKPLEGSAP